MKTILTTLMLTFGIFIMNTQTSQAQSTQRIVIKGATKANFSKAKFRTALKKAGLHKMDIKAVLKTLRYENNEFTVTLTQARIKIINQSKKFRIQNNMMSGMLGSSPI